MNYKKLIIPGILCLISASGIILHAAVPSMGFIQPNTVYTFKSANNTSSTQEDLKIAYNEKCLNVLKTYFDITPDTLPANTPFSIYPNNEKALTTEKDEYLKGCQQKLDQNEISQDEYTTLTNQIISQYNNRMHLLKISGHDTIDCDLTYNSTGNGRYFLSFNANTKELECAILPYSDEGWKIITDYVDRHVDYTLSADITHQCQIASINFIKDHQLAGITEPTLIHASSTKFYFYDATDSNKKAMIGFDPATHKIVTFYTGHSVSVLEDLEFKS